MNIDIKNTAKIEAVITATAGKAVAHTHSAAGIHRVVKKATSRLIDLGIPKKYWHNYQIISTSGYYLPKSYKYSVKRTIATIGFTKSGLARLQQLHAVDMWPGEDIAESIKPINDDARDQLASLAIKKATEL